MGKTQACPRGVELLVEGTDDKCLIRVTGAEKMGQGMWETLSGEATGRQRPEGREARAMRMLGEHP